MRTDPFSLVVSESLARREFSWTEVLGKRIRLRLEDQPEWFTVIGVVPDRRNLGSKEDFGPEIYLSGNQVAPKWAPVTLLVRTRTAPGSFKSGIRQAVRSLDYDQPVSQASLVSDRLIRTLRQDKQMGSILGAIGLFGLLMAMIGIYGVVSHSVAQRRFEMGVRMAVGAGKRDILKLILRYGFALAGAGVAIGAVIAAGVTVGISKNFFGVGGLDPITYMMVAGLMLLTAVLASVLPAIRATKINPMEALRSE